MASNLCDVCAAIQWYDLLQSAVRAKQQGRPEKWLKHHRDGSELEKVAGLCDICRLLSWELYVSTCQDGGEFTSTRELGQLDVSVKLERCVPDDWPNGYPEAYAVAEFRCKTFSQGWLWNVKERDEKVTFRINIHPGDELRSSVYGRLADPNPTSLATLLTVKNWITTCDQQHKACRALRQHSPFTSPIGPTRLLALGERTSQLVNLVYAPDDVQYVALSHCWGTSQPFVTTRDNLVSRTESIRVDEMPQTFQDAIRITRRLGLRYLWIDSLCIIQDDTLDWQLESAKMGSIYRWSWLVIAASNASSDVRGFLNPRTPKYKTVELKEVGTDNITKTIQLVCKPQHLWTYLTADPVCDEPLTQRGWAVQERYLACRTLFFATNQIFFECQDSLAAEDGDFIRRKHSYDAMMFKEPFGQQKHAGFYQSVAYFSKCKLSRASDKLPALSGLASKMPWATGDHYIAGIWRRSWIGGLLWSRVDKYLHKPSEWRAPSFSWASIDGDIRFPFYEIKKGAVEETAELIDHTVSLEGQDTYGAVRSVSFKFIAPFASVREHYCPDPEASRYLNRAFEFKIGDYIIRVFGNFDDENILRHLEYNSLSICLLAQVLDESNLSVLYEDRLGLVLREVREFHTERIVYQRVGIIKGRFESVRQPPAASSPQPSSFDKKFDTCMTCGLYDYVNSNVRLDGNTDWVSASMPRRALNLI